MSPVAPGDFVKVEYHGINKRFYDSRANDRVARYERDDESPLVLMWNSRKYVIPVGGEGFVPFEAAANAFGDPRAAEKMGSYKDESGNVGFILDRATEVRRLRVLYDNQTGNEGEVDGYPEVSLYDLEGNPISTVLDDPSGLAVHPIATTQTDRDSLLAQLQRQQRMIELLAQQQGIDLSNANLAVQETEVDADGNLITSTPDEFAPEPPTVPEDKNA